MINMELNSILLSSSAKFTLKSVSLQNFISKLSAHQISLIFNALLIFDFTFYFTEAIYYIINVKTIF